MTERDMGIKPNTDTIGAPRRQQFTNEDDYRCALDNYYAESFQNIAPAVVGLVRKHLRSPSSWRQASDCYRYDGD